MRPLPLPAARALPLFLLLLFPPPAAGQDPPDSLPTAPIDTLETRPSTSPVQGDPRLTWLGDTLGPADTLLPKFSQLPETWPDSLVNPYVPPRPGDWPAWTVTGDQLAGRGAYSLLDVIESEAPILANDLGGGGYPAFLGSPIGWGAGVQVVIDGVPAGSPLAESFDLRALPVEGIARISFYPGAQVAAWGGDGTGGVLEIVTRRSLTPTARSMLSFHLGSNDAQAFSGYFGRSIGGRAWAFVAANFDDTEGGVLPQGDFTRNQLVVKAGWRIGGRHRIEVARISSGLSGESDRTTIPGIEDQDANRIHAFYHGGFGPLEARLHGYREQHEILENYEFQVTPVGGNPDRVPGLTGSAERRGVRGEATVRRGGLAAWAWGASERSEAASTHPAFLASGGGSVLDPPAEGGSAALRIPNPRERTEWGGGAGWESLDIPVAGHVAVRATSHGDAAEDATAWRAAVSGRPLPALTLRASAGRSEAPAGLAGQAILATLRAAEVEIHPLQPADPGALARWSDWRAEASWSSPGWRVTGRAFGARGEGAFLWSPPSAWLYFDPGRVDLFILGEIPFNAFDAVDMRVNGFEGEAVVPLPFGVQGRAAWRRLDATEDLSDAAVPYVPENQGFGQLRWARRFFPSRDLLVETRLTGRYVGERTSVLPEPLPSFAVTDLLVQATIINFTISVSYKNLFGTGHRSETEFFLPGREGYLSIVWRFRE
ncbi:MAG TPA: TonB-dependent receptor plug domain-containing protein [Gemmatimonadota bacterium]|nr:TonB-dependent receptor plug domain-containing protein [Gemmatimonadota bacterium]